MTFIKGYTSWGLPATYRFIILNDILIHSFVGNGVDVKCNDWNSIWHVFAEFDIKYYINSLRGDKYQKIIKKGNNLYTENVSRQTMVNELRCSRFDSKFDNFLTGEK